MNIDLFLSKPTFIRVSTKAALLFDPKIKRSVVLDTLWEIHIQDVRKRVFNNYTAYTDEHFNGGVFSTNIQGYVVFMDRAFAPKFNRVTEILTPEEFAEKVDQIAKDTNSVTWTDEEL